MPNADYSDPMQYTIRRGKPIAGPTARGHLFVVVLAMMGICQPTVSVGQTTIDRGEIVRAILSRAQRNEAALGNAIATLTRFGEIQSAVSLVKTIDVAQRPPAELIAIQRAIGGDARLKLLADPAVDDAARAILRRLSDIDTAARTDPAALQSAVQTILSPQSTAVEIAAATRRLDDGGTAAVAAIAGGLIKAQPPVSARREIDARTLRIALRIALRIDDRFGDALVPWIIYGSPAASDRATDLLARLARDDNAIALAIGRFRRRGVTDLAAAETLSSAFVDSRRDHLTMVDEGQSDEVWVFDNESSSIRSVRTGRVEAVARRDADLAAGIQTVAPPVSSAMDHAIAADISYRVVIDPDWGDDATAKSYLSSHPSLRSAGSLRRVYEAAESLGDDAAVLGCIRLSAAVLGEDAGGDGDLVRASLLTEVLSHPVEQIRFDAALGLAKIQTPIAGQSAMMAVLAESATLPDRGVVILVETRPEIIGAIQSRMAGSPLDVEVVASGRALRQRLAGGGDVRLVLSKKQLPDITPIELVDRVVTMPGRGDVPVVFYREPPIDDELGIYTASGDPVLSPEVLIRRFEDQTPVREIDYPRTTDAIVRLVRQTQRTRRVPPLSDADRRVYRDQAVRAIAQQNDRRTNRQDDRRNDRRNDR